jgi:hypothetical protein
MDSSWMNRQVNVSLNAFIERGFVYSLKFPLPPSAEIARKIVTAICTITLAGFTYVSSAAPARERDIDSRAFSLWAVATVLLAPTAWFHYMVLLFIPFAQLASAATLGRASNRAVWMGAASVLTLSGAMILRVTLGQFLSKGTIAVVREAPFAALVMAYISAYWFVKDRIGEVCPGAQPALAQVGVRA